VAVDDELQPDGAVTKVKGCWNARRSIFVVGPIFSYPSGDPQAGGGFKSLNPAADLCGCTRTKNDALCRDLGTLPRIMAWIVLVGGP